MQPVVGIVMGGLLISQFFTLYTTPVIYVYLDRLGARLRRATARFSWRTQSATPDVTT